MAVKTKKAVENNVPSPFKQALPASLHVGKDKLLLRLDFYQEAIVMQSVGRKGEGAFKMVSPHDLAHALTRELTFSSGMLPPGVLWWSNTRGGPAVALWVEPGMRRLALQEDIQEPPQRYNVPLPGLIFICRPAQAPWVYAAYSRPAGPRDRVYKAPFTNVYDNGFTCAGGVRYPADMGAVPQAFLVSFFAHAASAGGRSKKHPDNIVKMWRELDKKKADAYPLADLIYHGTVKDLMEMSLK